jgi:hypothetical protein
MLRNPSWETTDALARTQWQLYRSTGEAARLSDEDCRRVLLLSQQEWAAWSGFVHDEGALPASPPLPVMLHRLGRATYRLANLAERQPAGV